MTERAHAASACLCWQEEWSPSGLLDWLHIRLVDILRGEVNTYGNYRFPASPNSLTWPELARQLLMVTQAQVAMGMTKEEMGEGVGAWMRVSLDWWLVAQQGRKGARAMVQRLNAAYFDTPQLQPALSNGGEDEEEDEEEEEDTKGKKRGKGKKGGAKKEEEEATGDGEGEGAAVGEMLAEAELDVEVRIAVWRAIVAWSLQHNPQLLARVINPPKRGWKGGPRGRRGRKRGAGSLGGQRPAKRKVMSALGCRFKEEGREYIQDLYIALKVIESQSQWKGDEGLSTWLMYFVLLCCVQVYREKELPCEWTVRLLSLLDAFNPADIRSAVGSAIGQVKALLPNEDEKDGLFVVHEELRGACGLDPRRCKEVALRCLLTHLTHLTEQGHVFPDKPQPDPPQQQEVQPDQEGGQAPEGVAPLLSPSKGRGSKALVRMSPRPQQPSEGVNGRSRRRTKPKHYREEDSGDEMEEDTEEEESPRRRGASMTELSDTDSDEEGMTRRRQAKPSAKMRALAEDAAEEAAALAPTRVSARAASRRSSEAAKKGRTNGKGPLTDVPVDSELAKVHGKMPNGRYAHTQTPGPTQVADVCV
jgi:hypothetical protein